MLTNSITIRRSLSEWEEFCRQVALSTELPIGESKANKDARKARAKADYNFFTKTYFPLYADGGKTDCAYFHIDAAKAILKDLHIMAAIEWPREHAKTVHMVVILVLWLMINDELDGLILIGRNKDLAADALADIKAILENNLLFKYDWAPGGDFQTHGDWQSGDFTTKNGIRFLALGLGQAPQGVRKGAKRPNLCICSDLDDYEIVQNQRLVQNKVDWIEGALMPAIAIKQSRFIIEGNRIHPQGILATFIGDTKPGRPKRKGLYHNKVYATQKPGVKYSKAFISEGGVPSWERYTVEDLQRKFDKIGIVKTKGEYYHDHAIIGRVFHRFQWMQAKPLLKKAIAIEGYIDPSFENNVTSDYKAARVWALLKPRTFLCVKSYVRKSSLTDLFRWIGEYNDQMAKSNITILWRIEKQWITAPIRDALASVNRERKAFNLKPVTIISDTRKKENKFVRIMNMEPKFNGGDTYFAEEEFNNEDMIEGNNQLKGIEPGYKGADDAPDADEGCWHYLSMHTEDRTFKPVIKRHTRKSKY